MLAYVAAVAYLFVHQRDYVFKPSGTLAAPADKGLPGVETIGLTASDGTALTGWYQPASPGQPTVLYFQGNAGNISSRADRFRQIVGSKLGLLALSYRGYPGGEGVPSEAALVSDGIEAFDWLAARGADVIVYGESLGTGVAVQVAAARPGRALILEAPFTAAVDLAAAAYPWVPVGWLMRDPFLSREHIQRVHVPLMIVHGTEDSVVPIGLGRQLLDAANEPKIFVSIAGGAHSDLWSHGLWPLVLDFLARHP